MSISMEVSLRIFVVILFSATSILCLTITEFDNSGNKTASWTAKELQQKAKTLRIGRQDTSVSAPVAASLAFVGLNLAFISLLVPFVMASLAVSERSGRSVTPRNHLINLWKVPSRILHADSKNIEA